MFSYINYQLHLYFKTTFILAAQREETASKELIFVMVFQENLLGLFYLPLTRTLSIRSITYLFWEVGYWASVKEHICQRCHLINNQSGAHRNVSSVLYLWGSCKILSALGISKPMSGDLLQSLIPHFIWLPPKAS